MYVVLRVSAVELGFALLTSHTFPPVTMGKYIHTLKCTVIQRALVQAAHCMHCMYSRHNTCIYVQCHHVQNNFFIVIDSLSPLASGRMLNKYQCLINVCLIFIYVVVVSQIVWILSICTQVLHLSSHSAVLCIVL